MISVLTSYLHEIDDINLWWKKLQLWKYLINKEKRPIVLFRMPGPGSRGWGGGRKGCATKIDRLIIEIIPKHKSVSLALSNKSKMPSYLGIMWYNFWSKQNIFNWESICVLWLRIIFFKKKKKKNINSFFIEYLGICHD